MTVRTTLPALAAAPDVALVALDLMPRLIANADRPHPGRQVLTHSLRLAGALRQAGGQVVWVRSERPAEEQPPGSGLANEIAPHPEDAQLIKHTWGAFTGTGLHDHLQRKRINTLWLTGLTTGHAVESTARAADELGYRLVLVEDAMTARTTAEHEHPVSVTFPLLGTVTSHRVLLAATGRDSDAAEKERPS